MKVSELIQENPRGIWRLKNKSGKVKAFRDATSKEAIEWMNSGSPELPTKIQRSKPKSKSEKISDDQIYNHVQNVIGSTFPDGDPIDHLGTWLKQNDITMDDVNRVFKKREKTDMYGYMASMWDDYAADAVSDAERVGATDDSPYYRVDSNGKVTKNSNPFR